MKMYIAVSQAHGNLEDSERSFAHQEMTEADEILGVQRLREEVGDILFCKNVRHRDEALFDEFTNAEPAHVEPACFGRRMRILTVRTGARPLGLGYSYHYQSRAAPRLEATSPPSPTTAGTHGHARAHGAWALALITRARQGRANARTTRTRANRAHCGVTSAAMRSAHTGAGVGTDAGVAARPRAIGHARGDARAEIKVERATGTRERADDANPRPGPRARSRATQPRPSARARERAPRPSRDTRPARARVRRSGAGAGKGRENWWNFGIGATSGEAHVEARAPARLFLTQGRVRDYADARARLSSSTCGGRGEQGDGDGDVGARAGDVWD